MALILFRVTSCVVNVINGVRGDVASIFMIKVL
ncbi:hypothetical protein Poly59_59560 [Rubripirellula reticaptiva]|uniref:Uncharacterized protein n=1 Tax=Rubripirellula reticaptiva TaxID=2528013 RepID=A0A5C6ED83_9BACT|nr:hypothetical protein Poly59_59560 [Rubripirellula reticaptiva]